MLKKIFCPGVKWVPSHCHVLIREDSRRDSAAQMTNLWVTGTRWDESKYLQCSGSSISRLVTVNIFAMSQWNVSWAHFVALSLAECEATCPPVSCEGLSWSFSCDTATAGTLGSALRPSSDVVVGSWDSCRIAGGMMKKGSCCQSACATQTLSSLLKEAQVTSVAVSRLRGGSRPSPSDSPHRERKCKI